MTDYTYWRDALAGNFAPVHDGDAFPGFYKAKNNPKWAEKTGRSAYAVAIWSTDDGMKAVRSLGIGFTYPVEADDVFMWCHDKPITEDQYRAVAERGEFWPDEIPPALSNNPPEGEVEADEVDAAIAAALAAMKEPITDQAGADRLGNHRDRLSKLYKSKEIARKAEKQPHLDAGAEVDAKFKPILTKIEVAGKAVKAVITKWLLAEDARLQAEAREKMKAEEAARKEAAANNEPPPPAPMSVAERPKVGTTGRATALRTYKSAIITDYAKALAHYGKRVEVETIIQQLADRDARADVVAPGCQIKEERRAS